MWELKGLQSTRPSYIESALKTLPTTLDEVYNRMIAKIHPSNRQDALVMLRWLAYSQRPLTLRELSEATIIDPYKGDGVVDIDDRGSPGDVLEILSGLIVVVEMGRNDWSYRRTDFNFLEKSSWEAIASYDEFESYGCAQSPIPNIAIGHQKKVKIVRLAHFSVQEYFESTRTLKSSIQYFHLQEDKDQRFLCNCCLIYLLHYASSEMRTKSGKDFMIFPLLEYSARFWFVHFRDVGDISRGISLLDSDKAFSSWISVHDPCRALQNPFKSSLATISKKRKNQLRKKKLYVVAFLGIFSLAKILLEEGADVNAQVGQYGNALQAASHNGHTDIVTLLIEHKADVNAKCGYYNNALQAASYNGHNDIVSILIERKADVNAQGGVYRYALLAASKAGHVHIVNTLIEHGADVNEHHWRADSPLTVAIKAGREQIVKRLIDAGTDINAEGLWYRCPVLLVALKAGRERIAKILIKHGADVHVRHESSGNAITSASRGGFESIVKMLIEEYNVDVNARDENSENPLVAAAAAGQKRIVEMLIEEYNADVNACDKKGESPLFAASVAGHEEIVKILIRHNANINACCSNYQNENALLAASKAGLQRIIKILIEHKAAVNAKNRHGNTALKATFFNGYSLLQLPDARTRYQIIKMLIDAGADVNAQLSNGRYWSPLRAASAYGNEEIFKLLIGAGADVHAIKGEGFAILATAVLSKSVGIVRLLIGNGLRTDSVDLEWSGLLHVAVSQPHGTSKSHRYEDCSGCQMVDLLLNEGVQVDVKDKQGDSPLAWAIKRGDIYYTQLLLKAKANANTANRGGSTPLHIAANSRITSDYAAIHDEIMRILIHEGAQVNLRDNDGATPLHLAARGSRINAVYLLIGAKADVNCLTNRNESPLTLAIIYGPLFEELRIEVVQTLIDAGANIKHTQIIDGKKWTPLRYAASCPYAGVVRPLLDATTDPCIDCSGETILHIAASSGNLEVVNLFLTEIDDPNSIATGNSHPINTTLLKACDNEGRNALHFAAKTGETHVFNHLVEYGLLPDLVDKNGKTCLDYACMSGKPGIVKRVLAIYEERSIELRPVLNWSPMHWACRRGNFQILTLLSCAGYITGIVKTAEPSALWSALDVAVYHQNGCLILKDYSLRDHDWESISQSGITAVSSDNQAKHPIAYRKNHLICDRQVVYVKCNGCLSVGDPIPGRL